ncbi:nicotinamide mononucleotide transporter family protein [Kutzneria viridogrisea]|uniref:Nicotinamide mononucleotide transporter n=2 Tax=Kutzneria TaxID=43356 RepID=W5WAK4_9PSEU|nr:nicotinamide riboside transporter PnuC [Kutzneria albida]AHH95219.1 nicotinamide mononucleotide transporter [Kutzneria albida DSM 43870]MBA8927424.1 nicotinamide mononucleotide transporter [Kutzneria viridogrisea]
MNWLLENGLLLLGERISFAELIGQIGAVAVVFLAQRRTLWTWPVQLLAAVLLFSVYSSAHLGGLAIRQVIVFGISCYGWWAWTRRRDPVFGIEVRRSTRPELLGILAALVIGTVGMALLLQQFNASWAPWPDAAIFIGTAVAYAAQGLRLVEFWLIWLLVDAVGVPLQLASGLYFSAAVYIVFAGLVVKGWLDWARTARSISAREPAQVSG